MALPVEQAILYQTAILIRHDQELGRPSPAEMEKIKTLDLSLLKHPTS